VISLATPLAETEVLQACRTLFGSEVTICSGFLLYLQPEGLKSAYRKKAKETHPDLFSHHEPHVQRTQASRFRDVVRAYDIVRQFVKLREDGLWRAPRRMRARRSSERRQHGRSNTHAYEHARGRTAPQRTIPLRPLQIGHYLYYRGLIPYRALIDAVVWQRKQRPVIGDLAVRWGWLDASGIERIIRATNGMDRFGERAVGLGLLTAFQVKTLLFFQHSQQERLGRYFVKKRLLTEKMVEDLVRDLREHNAEVRRVAVRRPANG
jgi:curved DNA-binding protein CbpA